MTGLEQRILQLSYKYGLSHIGSCLSSVEIIDDIHGKMKVNDKFVLSSGHAGLALYVVLEKYWGINAETLFEQCGVHPDRLAAPGFIHCSTGSLGQGLPIALGMAMADKSRKVYCLLSDGECAEGSVYEALNVKYKYEVSNLIVFVNFNGYAAYDTTTLNTIAMLRGIKIIDTSDHWFIKKYGQEAHYKILNADEYAETVCQPVAYGNGLGS